MMRELGRAFAPVALLLATGCGPEALPAADEQPDVLRQYQFTHDPGVTIEVLSPHAFERRYGDNPDLPRTDGAVLALAHKVFVAPQLLALEPGETCLERWEGTVLAALTNPLITDNTRRRVDQLMAEPVPKFKQTHVSGPFKFRFNTADPDPRQNVTLAQIKATAKVLQAAWGDYAKHFATPKAKLVGGQPQLEIRVYYLGKSLYGSTSSFSNYIRLNTAKTVGYRCKRESTPVHELFHRVQYTHGYRSGQAYQYWAVEGTAAWSQKYLAPHIGDYLSRVSSGLNSPDKALLSRKYDAIHLWLHLGRQAGSERAAVQQLWQRYAARWKLHRRPLVPALNDTLSTLVGRNRDHEWLVEQWSMANLLLDAPNAKPEETYHELGQVRRCEASIYGPLPPVKRQQTALVKAGAPITAKHGVNAYGSDYLLFNVDLGVKQVELEVAGTIADFAFNVVETDGLGQVVGRFGSGRRKQSFKHTSVFKPGAVRRVALVVTGMGRGGDYEVKVTGK